jgi:transketolase
MRNAFSDSLVRLARQDPNILLLTGDHGYALFDPFRKACPEQYINAGIAEQNMVGMAAGLARSGFRPFVYGLAAFIPVRVLEQIKLDIAHDALPVVLLGDGAGFVYSHLGTSHQSTEDIACARAIPGLADRFEMSMCMQAAYDSASPVYLRMGKSDRGDVHAEPVQARRGDVLNLRRGSPGGLAFVATGSMVRTALDLATLHHPSASVWSVPFVKPIDEDQIATLCSTSRGVVVLEEHSVVGGLGGTVAEIAGERAPVRLLRVGVRDRYSAHCGSYGYLLHEHGLDAEAVAAAVRAFDMSVAGGSATATERRG